MASIETRPYQTVSPDSVQETVSIVAPELESRSLNEVWQTGQDVEFDFSVMLRATFASEASLPLGAMVSVVAIATCTVARKTWQSRVTVQLTDIDQEVKLALVVPGDQIAYEIKLDLWVIGDGVAGPQQIHHGAKLWEMGKSRIYPLESGTQAFPTSAVSFRLTNRPAVPWGVEIEHEANPDWKVSSSLRLFINTDFPLSESILENTAGDEVFQQIKHDIYFVTIQHVSHCYHSGAASLQEIEEIAENDHESLAALAQFGARKVTFSLGHALSKVAEEPYLLIQRLRETFSQYERTK